MQTKIDRLGRVVIPKSLRDELGLAPGTVIDIEARDGAFVGRTRSRVRVGEDEHGPFFELDDEGEKLTAEQVRRVLDEGRR